MSRVELVEVGMRDGLQNEPMELSTNKKLELARRLADCGFRRMEAGSFVSPKWVPQMADSSKIISTLLAESRVASSVGRVRWSALVPNMVGYENAKKAGVKEIAIFGAISNTFSQKNINVSVTESLRRFEEVIANAKKDRIRVRGYVSTVFGCPYEGKISAKVAFKVIEKFLDLGVYELSLGDTIGVATPKQVKDLLVLFDADTIKRRLAMHFHDTRGTALANIAASLDMGAVVFDSSIGGLGGCPYAPGAAGNVATEDVVYMLEGMGYNTGLNLDKLIETTKWIQLQLKRDLPARLPKAGHSCIY
jgi:hydroxymethylglutaryl-CoA lyase